MNKSALVVVIIVFACIQIFAGFVLLYMACEANKLEYTWIGLVTMVSSSLTFGFAKIVEAAEKYLDNDK